MANDFPGLPFEIGTTYGSTDTTTGANWEGRTYWVEDKDYSTSPAKPRAFGPLGWRRLMVVRNVSGGVLLPGMFVKFKLTAFGKHVDGYSASSQTEDCFPVDEFLNSTTGCPNNDLCYIVIQGPAAVRISATAAESVISAGSELFAVTAAASTFSTTAGRVLGLAALDAASTHLATRVRNRIGIMLSDSTTAHANTNRLAYIFNRGW